MPNKLWTTNQTAHTGPTQTVVNCISNQSHESANKSVNQLIQT